MVKTDRIEHDNPIRRSSVWFSTRISLPFSRIDGMTIPGENMSNLAGISNRVMAPNAEAIPLNIWFLGAQTKIVTVK